jgi:PAS domain S-box-containing protein
MSLKTNDKTKQRSYTEDTFLGIIEATAGLTGQAFYEAMTKTIAVSLDVRHVLLAELDGDDAIKATSFWSDGDWRPGGRYSIENTPSRVVVNEGEYFCPEGLQSRFPLDKDLADLKADSYFGQRIIGSEGETLGLVSILDDAPLKGDHWLRSIMNILTARTGAELERTRATTALNASEDRFRDLADHMPGIVFSYHQDAKLRRKLLYMGPGAEEMIGPDLTARIRDDIDTFFSRIHPDDVDKLLSDANLAVREDMLYTHSFRVRVEGGSYRWMEVRSKAKPLPDGERIWNGLLFDITDRKEADNKLRDSSLALEENNRILQNVTAKAQAASQAKTEFLANMSHEIRTPMTAILGYTDILVEKVEDQENSKALNIIQDHGRYLLQIINDILDLSTIEAGRLELNYSRVSIFQLINNVQELMRVRAHEKGLSLTVDFDGRLPAVLRTDPVRLRQVLINLLSNAIKFTERGGVRMTTRFHNDAVSLPTLEIEIRDTGVGMSKEQQKELFLPFAQGDTSNSRRYGGAGLGLSISKRLAELLGGTIGVESREGKGSCFRVVIGAGLMDDTKLINAEEGMAFLAVPKELPMGPERLNLRILLAEDNRTNQRLIRHILEKLGAWVAVVENGRQAVDAAMSAWDRDESFDMILMDIQMPGMDGHEATRELRRRNYEGPIIALTAHAMESDREACLEAGCNDHCTKPVDRVKLVESILAQLTPAEA